MSIDRSTLAQWVAGSCRLLSPLVSSLEQYVLSAQKLHADDTSMPVLDPGRGRTKRGYLWSYVRDDRASGGLGPPAVWFAYSPDRKGAHPQRHFRDFTGLLQTDSYAGFDAIAERAPNKPSETNRTQSVLCLGHARRHFHDLHVAVGSPIAFEALERFGQLYGIERAIKGCSPEERHRARQAHAVPRLQALRAWLAQTLVKVPKNVNGCRTHLTERLGS